MADTGYDLNLPSNSSQRPTYTYRTQRPDGKTITLESDHPLSQDEARKAFQHFGVNLADNAKSDAPTNPRERTAFDAENADRHGLGLARATGLSPEPGILDRMENAIGPSIRGAGDVLGVNRLLEELGVPQGRLTGPEATARDAATRRTAGVGGLATLGMQAIPAAADALGALKASRTWATAAAAAGRVGTPLAKYWAARKVLEWSGVSPGLAETAAVLLSGYSGKNGPAPAAPPELPPNDAEIQSVGWGTRAARPDALDQVAARASQSAQGTPSTLRQAESRPARSNTLQQALGRTPPAPQPPDNVNVIDRALEAARQGKPIFAPSSADLQLGPAATDLAVQRNAESAVRSLADRAALRSTYGSGRMFEQLTPAEQADVIQQAGGFRKWNALNANGRQAVLRIWAGGQPSRTPTFFDAINKPQD